MKIALVIIALFATFSLQAQHTQPEELGTVQWLRNYDKALAAAKQLNKPVFILFQEVPGCATCRNYGNHVLSHPLIAEAIENEFIPLAIYNNKGGDDAKILKSYQEPAWNNPVVRLVDADGIDISDRISGNYSQLGVVKAMTEVLGDKTPNYLNLLCEELLAEAEGTQTATFSMYCFWTGEGQLGQLEGVMATEPGFMNGREVVQVKFNPNIISFEKLVKAGSQVKCADQVFTNDNQQKTVAEKLLGKNAVAGVNNFRLDNERKYYLSKTIYRFVPMTPLQAARANALVGKGKSPDAVLSPKQVQLAKYIEDHANKDWKNVIGEDLISAWEQVNKKVQ
ncbi:MAG: VPGUxxT family thioredoxin-like (seleno)protein, type 2 [Saprospiraceae bacterium]